MKKSFFFIFTGFLITFLLVNLSIYVYLSKPLYMMPMLKDFSLDFSLLFDKQSFYFIFMVSIVTSMVVLYSEFYMEHYNNKKFFFLTMAFLSSMIFLVLGGNILFIMVGWDGLGLSSIFLIMFYPTKTSLSNSILTFFFNRLGDCVMIVTICLIFMNSSSISSFLQKEEIFFILLGLTLCSFTKSAQFPVSSWLPAAMSAPTPISAMVHSSTLVTAGVFLIYKFHFFLYDAGMSFMLLYVFVTTFLLGGLMGGSEMDFKKVVAFSTMSQISMVLIFCSLGLLSLSFTHMIYHAFFKTMLFCCCGISFMWVFSDQLMKSFNMQKNYIFIYFLIFVSLYCMSGLPYSASFYSKHVFMEWALEGFDGPLFLSSMLGSLLTIKYSKKVFSVALKSFQPQSPSFNKKKSYFGFMIFFIFLTFFSPFLVYLFLPCEFLPLVNDSDLGFMSIMVFLFFFVEFSFPHGFSFFTADLFFSKTFMFSFYGKLFWKDSLSLSFNDHMIFKPKTFFNLKKSLKKKSGSVMMFIFFLYLYWKVFY